MNDFVREVLDTGKAIRSREYDPPRFPGRTDLADVIPLRNMDGEMTGLLTSRIDITDRKQMETALTEQTLMLHEILDNLPTQISLRDVDGLYVFANRALATRMGRPAEAFIGKSFEELFDDADGISINEFVNEVLRTGEPIRSREHTAQRFPGETGLVDVIPLRNSAGEMTGPPGVAHGHQRPKGRGGRIGGTDPQAAYHSRQPAGADDGA